MNTSNITATQKDLLSKFTYNVLATARKQKKEKVSVNLVITLADVGIVRSEAPEAALFISTVLADKDYSREFGTWVLAPFDENFYVFMRICDYQDNQMPITSMILRQDVLKYEHVPVWTQPVRVTDDMPLGENVWNILFNNKTKCKAREVFASPPYWQIVDDMTAEQKQAIETWSGLKVLD